MDDLCGGGGGPLRFNDLFDRSEFQQTVDDRSRGIVFRFVDLFGRGGGPLNVDGVFGGGGGPLNVDDLFGGGDSRR